MFRTRQAPSPTGYLHLGNARTVLFTKLLADKLKGTWYLRLEDTDRTRLQPDAVIPLLESLESLGLTNPEGISIIKSSPLDQPDEFYGLYQKGYFGPYIQSQRLKIYHQHVQELINKQLVYWSYLSEVEKQELQEIKKVSKKPINYFLTAQSKHPQKLWQTLESALNDDHKPVLRYKIQRQKKIICEDLLLGKSEFDLSLEEDFIILKSDGFPTYHLAHLIDDMLMQTSLVIRSQEWYPSFPKHIQMFLDYWGKAPEYLHLPFVLGEKGNKKMSKRDGNVNIQKDYLAKGYLPEAIINYLAFLGWNPGTEKELYLDETDFLN